jgi:epoxyqueuosine reductase
MSKFHNTISRRNFMKALGLAGAGLGAATATMPVFHDLDELAASPLADQKRPWYVKERDYYDPTTDIDWDVKQRFNRELRTRDVWTDEVADKASSDGKARMAQGLTGNLPGYSFKTQTLAESMEIMRDAIECDLGWTGVQDEDLWIDTPEERGVPKWTGTPEENGKLMQAASRYFGGALMGFAEMDSRWRNKVVVDRTRNGAIVYEDVDQGYQVGGRRIPNSKQVIPNKPMYAFVAGTFDCFDMSKYRQGVYPAPNRMGGVFHRIHHPAIWNFLRGLGYQMLGDGGHQTDPTTVGESGVLTGLAELSRQGYYSLSPEAGTLLNMESFITDLPLPSTKPIDAGMFRFCSTCKMCSNSCPVDAISVETEPAWEPWCGTVNGVETHQHNVGHKHFAQNICACDLYRDTTNDGCYTCYGACTFAVGNEAMVHSVVKGLIPTTSLLNGFFASMGEAFGYGLKDDPEAWWDDLNRPIMGTINTIVDQ